MKEYTKNRESQSRTVESNSNGFSQPPVSEILQAYRNGTLGRNPIQRESIEEEDDLTSGQPPVSTILQQYSEKRQRYASEEDEEMLQGKFEATQRQEKTNNTGLPDNLKSGIENLSGYSMDDVKVHYNSDKPAQLNALAYAQGTDIHVAPGQEKHLPHEAWHIVQQKQGRVQPTIQMQGVNVNDNEGLEKEADVMGEKAVQNKNYRLNLKEFKAVINHDKIQRKVSVQDEEIKPLVDQIKEEDSYIICNNSEKEVLIKKGIISQTVPLTAHNKHKLHADVEITLKEEHLNGGLKIDPSTTINADGRTCESIPVIEDTGLIPIFDITGVYRTIKKEVGKEKRAIVPRDLSGATVLLHEMGHAVQYLETLLDLSAIQSKFRGGQLFNMPTLCDSEKVSDDILQGNIRSKYWALRVFELSDMGMILNILKDIFTKEEEYTKLYEIEILRLRVLERVKIWMEHDVMINVEHPFAQKHNEGIRLRHGEELDQRDTIIEKEGKWVKLTYGSKEDRTVKGKGTLTADNAKCEMIARLQQDSNDLPEMISRLVSSYQAFLKAYVGNFDNFLVDYVDDDFKS